MIVTILAAIARNGTIGAHGELPWHLPNDFKRVKRLSLGHTLIMGRHTFESIGVPLPGRRSIVLSHNPAYHPAGAEHAASFEQALAMARDAGENEVFVFGGAEVFRRALPVADRLELTIVEADVAGDTQFPPWDPSGWQQVATKNFEADARHAFAFSFRTWIRRQEAPP